MQKLPLFGAALGALALAGTALPAHAAFKQITSLSQINPLGVFSVPDGGALGTLTSQAVATAAGNTATFTDIGNMNLYDSTGANTAFSDGLPLLETYDTTPPGTPTGPLSITFSQGIQAFGLFGQGAANSGTTTFTLTAYNGLTSLGSFSVGPLSDDNATDPAALGFLGGIATGSDVITGIKISSVSPGGTGDDAIYGPVTFGTAVVPESSSLVLIGLGLLPLAGLALRARKRISVRA